MAIKVGGTTVINDSRQLSNIASVDAATVSALGAAGVGGGGGGIELTTSEAVVEGDRLSFNFDTGKVEKVARVGGTREIFSSDVGFAYRLYEVLYIPEVDKTAFLMYNSTNNNMGVMLATQDASTGAYTFGSYHYLSSGNYDGTTLAYDSNVNRLLAFYRVNNTLSCRACSISGTTLSTESTATIDTSVGMGFAYKLAAYYNASDNYTYIMYDQNNGYAVARVGTIGASSQSWSSADGPSSNRFAINYANAFAIISVGSTVIFHWSQSGKKAIAGQWSGSSWTWGSQTFLTTDGSSNNGPAMAFRLSGTGTTYDAAYLAKYGNNTGVFQYNVSGTTISPASPYSVHSNSGPGCVGGYDPSDNKYYSFAVYNNDGVLAYNKTASNTWLGNFEDIVYYNNGDNIVCGTLNTQTGFFTVGNETNFEAYSHRPIEDNYETFIGVAAEAASANTAVKINNAGTIATGLSGLTPTRGYQIKFDGTFRNADSFEQALLNSTNRAKTTGIALTSTTMLMLNDFLTTN
jgi:hypothetical protein